MLPLLPPVHQLRARKAVSPFREAPTRGPSHPQIPLQLRPALPALRLGIKEAPWERTMSRSSRLQGQEQGSSAPGFGEERDLTPEGPPSGTQHTVHPVS